MALKSRNETENLLRIYVPFHVERTRRALGMFLFPFLKRNNEIRNALSNFPRFHPRTQANIDISAYDSIGPSSILPITRFLRGYCVNSDYFVLLRKFLWSNLPTSNRPEKTTYAKYESATCGRSRRNGTRCLSVSFPETWNAQGYTLVCFEKRNAGENPVSFLLFHYRHVSTLALVVDAQLQREYSTYGAYNKYVIQMTQLDYLLHLNKGFNNVVKIRYISVYCSIRTVPSCHRPFGNIPTWSMTWSAAYISAHFAAWLPLYGRICLYSGQIRHTHLYRA